MHLNLLRNSLAAIALAGAAMSAWADTTYSSTVAATTGDGIVQFSDLAGLTDNMTYLYDAGKTNVNQNKSTAGNSLVVKGVKYASGVGTHAPSVAYVKLNGATNFYTILGIDDEADYPKDNHGVVNYVITGYKTSLTDSEELASGTITRQDSDNQSVTLNLDVAAYTYLKLDMQKGTQAWADHVDYCDARFTYSGTVPAVVAESDVVFNTTVKLTALADGNLTKITNGNSTSAKLNTATGGGTLTVKGTEYTEGLGLHAAAKVCIQVNDATAFHGIISIDDGASSDTNHGVVEYEILGYDDQMTSTTLTSGTISRTDEAAVTIDQTGLGSYKYLVLNFKTGTKDWADHVDVVDAYLTYPSTGTAPVLVAESEMVADGGKVYLNDLTGTANVTSGWANHAAQVNKNINGTSLILKGTTYTKGIGTHATAKAVISLKDCSGVTSFHALIGIDDDTSSKGNCNYNIILRDDKAIETTVMTGTIKGSDTSAVTVNLTETQLSGMWYLILDFPCGDDNGNDHVDIVDAYFTYDSNITDYTAPVIIAEADMTYDASKVVSIPAASSSDLENIPLSSLEISNITNGWGTIRANKSIDNNALLINGKRYMSGVGVHATAKCVVKLNGAVTGFHAVLGIDDEVRSKTSSTAGLCSYSVTVRKQSGVERTISSGTLSKSDTAPVQIDIDSFDTDDKYLILYFDKATTSESGNDSDHVDIANAYLVYQEQNSSRPEIVSESSLSSSLDCATTLFAQPNVRFMHKLHSNNEDATFTVSDLPTGLSYNEGRCLIEGTVETADTYTYNVTVSIPGQEDLTVPCTLTVTTDLQQPVPFMGWLSWNSIEGNISESIIKTVADNMKSWGLVDAGYKYLVIDDLWHASARESGTNKPLPDSTKFPNGMAVCADYVHNKGMKFGIYSDAAASTCAGAFGSYTYETIDATQYAEWGVDLLKYDYCGGPSSQAGAIERYTTMGTALKNSGRSILFYICEWGQRDPWKWGAEAYGSCWRATYDTRDCWIGSGNGVGVTQSITGMKDIWMYTNVNRFNDADMMCVGIHGTGKSSSDLCASGAGMTDDEYATQFSLWCMWASPLTLSNDMRNEFTAADLAMITNQELIALNQDRLCQAGQNLEYAADGFYVMSKDLENGDVAVSVTNLSSAAATKTVALSSIPGIDSSKEYTVRDVVNKADLTEAFDTDNNLDFGSVATHATKVYRLAEKKSDETNGIASVTEAVGRMTVSADGEFVQVCLEGSGSASKRILISDLTGRVLAATTTSEECILIPFQAPKGVYVVNVVCGGCSNSQKVTL